MENYRIRIKDLRKVNDYSQAQIAAYLNISQRTYSDYETGAIRIPLDILIQLARFYNVNMDFISGITNWPRKFPID